ncbi:methylated-DNA--[protein]-cysteine S-methyltransferase [Kineococcus sp. R8]|nr:methylated-DNA--[protein]-cysteine S-methyltransferase [Kineococcus siccus]
MEERATLARLGRALGHRAQDEDLLDVAYTTLDTPVGRLLLAGTVHGLVRVAFDGEGHDAVLQSLADRLGPRVLRAPARLDAVAAQLEEYFAGRRTAFDVPLDLSLAHGFRRSVVEVLPRIGFGTTASYAQVAALTGSPGAVRAVGTACARNPLPVVVPCHRVVRSDGSPGEYVGGAPAKLRLLALEARAG